MVQLMAAVKTSATEMAQPIRKNSCSSGSRAYSGTTSADARWPNNFSTATPFSRTLLANGCRPKSNKSLSAKPDAPMSLISQIYNSPATPSPKRGRWHGASRLTLTIPFLFRHAIDNAKRIPEAERVSVIQQDRAPIRDQPFLGRSYIPYRESLESAAPD